MEKAKEVMREREVRQEIAQKERDWGMNPVTRNGPKEEGVIIYV